MLESRQNLRPLWARYCVAIARDAPKFDAEKHLLLAQLVWKALELWFSTRQKNPALASDFGGRYSTLMLRARQKSTNADDRPRVQPMVGSYWRHARRWPGRGRYDGDVAFDRRSY